MSLSLPPLQHLSPVLPPELASLLGPPPLVRGEDGAAYEALFARIAVALKPRDIIEWLWARDVVDAAWEGARLRRLRASLRTLGQRRGLKGLLREAGLDPFPGPEGEVPAEEAADAYDAGEPEYLAAVDAALAERGYLREAIEAQMLRGDLSRLEVIDRMAAAADQRRDGVLREVERRRTTFAARLRLATAETFDVPEEMTLG
jgi:hypothetical protein